MPLKLQYRAITFRAAISETEAPISTLYRCPGRVHADGHHEQQPICGHRVRGGGGRLPRLPVPADGGREVAVPHASAREALRVRHPNHFPAELAEGRLPVQRGESPGHGRPAGRPSVARREEQLQCVAGLHAGGPERNALTIFEFDVRNFLRH